MKPIHLSESDLARLFGSGNPLAPLRGAATRPKKRRNVNPARDLARVQRAVAWARSQAVAHHGPDAVFVASRLKNHANGAQGGKGRQIAVGRERKSDRAKTFAACRAGRVLPRFPVRVRMVRLGPQRMDINGLWNALKSVMDGVADYFGPKDADPRYQWEVDQEITPPGCFGARIEFFYEDRHE